MSMPTRDRHAPLAPFSPVSIPEFPWDSVSSTLSSVLAGVVARHPDNIAIATPDRQWTYAQLSDDSERLAWAIKAALKDRPGPVAIAGTDRARALVCLWGVLRAGLPALTLPMDAPAGYRSRMLEHSGARLILEGGSSEGLAGGSPLPSLAMEDALHSRGSGDKLPASGPDTAAILFYTSGTSGQPKAVVQTHRGVLHRAWTHIGTTGIGPGCRQTQLTSLGFSACLPDVFGVMLSGAVVCPADLNQLGYTGFSKWLRENNITHLHPPVGFMRGWNEALEPGDFFPDVRWIGMGGQAVFSADLNHMKPHFMPVCEVELWLASTEASLHTVLKAPLGSNWEPSESLAGYPAPGKEISLGTQDGEAGEIVVASRYLSSGYWRNPKLTSSKFQDVPGRQSWRQYHTGDLGEKLPDGRIAFKGRADTLVKIRGHRVQLEDVENGLASIPGVREAGVVLSDADMSTTAELWAFVVLDAASDLKPDSIRSRLRERLPAPMIPKHIISVTGLPRTSTGKLDRRALAGNVLASRRPADELPEDVEASLVQIWEEVLGLSGIGGDDDFFDLGGNSLDAMRLAMRAESRFGRRFAPAWLFEATTVSQMAERIRNPHSSGLDPALAVVQSGGSQPPFFCASPPNIDVMAYRQLAVGMGDDQSFYALYNPGHMHPGHGKGALTSEAARYLAAIRSLQPHGPYYLGGYSFGGKIAFELAHLLMAQGETVGLLALMETYAPGYPTRAGWCPDWLFRSVGKIPRVQTQIEEFFPWVGMHFRNLMRLPWGDKARYVRQKLVNRRLRAKPRAPGDGAGGPSPERVVEPNWKRVFPDYQPEPYPGLVVIIGARRQPFGIMRDDKLGWGEYTTGPVETQAVSGFHDSILFGPRVQRLADTLRHSLHRARIQANQS